MPAQLAGPLQDTQRRKAIEAAIQEKAPKMYRSLQKSGKMKEFVLETDQNLLDSFEENLIKANQHLPETQDPLEHLQNRVEAERRTWEEALETWLDFSDLEETK